MYLPSDRMQKIKPAEMGKNLIIFFFSKIDAFLSLFSDEEPQKKPNINGIGIKVA